MKTVAYPRLIAAYKALRSIENAALTEDDAEAWDEAEFQIRSVLSEVGVQFTENGQVTDGLPVTVYPLGVKGCQVCERGRVVIEEGDLFSGNWPGLPVVCREHLPVVETMWFKRPNE